MKVTACTGSLEGKAISVPVPLGLKKQLQGNATFFAGCCEKVCDGPMDQPLKDPVRKQDPDMKCNWAGCCRAFVIKPMESAFLGLALPTSRDFLAPQSER